MAAVVRAGKGLRIAGVAAASAAALTQSHFTVSSALSAASGTAADVVRPSNHDGRSSSSSSSDVQAVPSYSTWCQRVAANGSGIGICTSLPCTPPTMNPSSNSSSTLMGVLRSDSSWLSPCRGMAIDTAAPLTAATAQDAEQEAGGKQGNDGLAAVQSALLRRVAPPRWAVRAMLRQCEDEGDVDRVLKLLARLRLDNAALRKQLHNFSEAVGMALVHACLRAKSPQKALLCLSASNSYGVTPSIGVAHVILKHARDEKDSALAMRALRRMAASGIAPTASTIDLLVSNVAGAEDKDGSEYVAEVVDRVADMAAAGVSVHASAFDTLLKHAVMHGCVPQVTLLLRLQHQALDQSGSGSMRGLESSAEQFEAHTKQKVPQSAEQAVVLSLAYALAGEVGAAVDVISSAANDEESVGWAAIQPVLAESLTTLATTLNRAADSDSNAANGPENPAVGEEAAAPTEAASDAADEEAAAAAESAETQPVDEVAADASTFLVRSNVMAFIANLEGRGLGPPVDVEKLFGGT